MELSKYGLQKTVGQNIKRKRCERGYTQSYLAEKAELSEGHIIQIEGGFKSPSILSLARIAMALDVSSEYLLFGESKSTSLENILVLLSSLSAGDTAKIEELLSFIKNNFLSEK